MVPPFDSASASAPLAGPWARGAPRVTRHAKGLNSLLARWRVARQFVLAHCLPARAPSHVVVPADLPPALVAALHKRGQTKLYSHQAAAYRVAATGRHVVLATPTASGKSLAYNLPVLARLCRDPDARALYLFPTKALCRDQEASLASLLGECGLGHGVVTYDGDTPADVRRKAREEGGVVMTNPDMLHTGMLPHHTGWARFFAGLCFIVIDELHTLRGVYGSHMANVLRRLKRIAAFHGASPQFLLASATIGNAKEHAEALVGEAVELVDQNGAGKGEQHVFVYNPPIVHPGLGIRQSVVKAAVDLTLDLLRANISCIVFGQSRAQVEVMLKYLREAAHHDVQLNPESIHSYRGGYLPSERRRIEQALRAGQIRCVVATQALELGIDIGSLEAVVCAGYPGTMAGLWQRFGRGGRRGNASLALLVTSSAPLDQYVASCKEMLLQAPIEHARIDSDNVEIVLQHLKCASFELPFRSGEPFGSLDAETVEDGLTYLCEHQVVHPVADGGHVAYHWREGSYPANDTSLRSIGWDNFVIIDQQNGRTIAEMDWRSAHTMLHEQAIYQHANEQWQVERLDYDNRKAFVRKVVPDYYTDATTHLKIAPLEVIAKSAPPWAPRAQVECAHGEVSIVEKVVGFKKIRYHTHDNVGFGEIFLPEMQMHTTSAWWTLLPGLVNELTATSGHGRAAWVDALRGLGHAVHVVAAMGLMVDPRDLGHSVEDGAQAHGEMPAQGAAAPFMPTLYLYDRMPGGVGLAERAFEQQATLWRQSLALLSRCGCTHGCPACVGPGNTDAPNPLRRTLCAQLLQAMEVA